MNKVLIVDDELHNRLLLQEILEDFGGDGIQLLSAANGSDALAIIRAEKPDLVFLDIMLPDIDRFAICQTVKNELGLDQIFIVILTAKGQEVDKRKAIAVKADLYIAKPFKIKVIVDVVERVFGNAVAG